MKGAVMNKNYLKSFLLLVFLISFLSFQTAYADVGPKPSMNFDFTQTLNDNQLTIVTGKMYECEQPDCSDATELQQLGPQGFECEEYSCNALAYGFSDYLKIEIQLSDGSVLQSNVFQKAGWLNSKYKVSIQDGALFVESKFNLIQSPTSLLLLCVGGMLFMTVAIVVVILLIVRSRAKRK
jgi:hypothetical protein